MKRGEIVEEMRYRAHQGQRDQREYIVRLVVSGNHSYSSEYDPMPWYPRYTSGLSKWILSMPASKAQ